MEADNDRTPTNALPPAEPAPSWSELLAAYRLAPSDQTSSLLVERLGPWLTSARKRLHAVPPSTDDHDVAQQLVLEVLAIAARWRPHCEDQWIPRKLVEAAERRVRRSLSRERARSAVELDPETPAPEVTQPALVLETPVGTASAADLCVIYRYKVLGEPLGVLARKAGVTQRQMRRRIQAARKRARA